jgi:hypothetical protein
MMSGLLQNLGFVFLLISILVSEISTAIPTEIKLQSGTSRVKADDEFALTHTKENLNWCMNPVVTDGSNIACPDNRNLRMIHRHSFYNWDSATNGVTPPAEFTDAGVANQKYAPNFFVPPYFHGFNHTHIITIGDVLNGQDLLISLEDRMISGKNFKVTKNADGTIKVVS